MQRWLIGFLAFLMIFAALIGWGYRNATADPVVRRANIALPRWPKGQPPITVALLSDLHLGNVTMDASRLERVVAQAAALKPDLAVIAGDFIGGHDPADAAVAPGLAAFSHLRPRFGVVAVLGNHDYWTDATRVRTALARAGVTVLDNTAIARGPLAIGGVSDEYTGHDRLPQTMVALSRLPGAPVVVTHAPDLAPRLSPATPLLLAGHTHCAQIYLPWLFAPRIPSRFGERYRCGLRYERNRAIVVTAGLGTSVVPFRFGAPPDLWLLTLGP